MNTNQPHLAWLAVIFAVFLFTACEHNPIHSINDNMKKLSETVKTIDSVNTRISEEVTVFSNHVAKYADSTARHSRK